MRFITEFEVPESCQTHMECVAYIPGKKYSMEVGMGDMISKSFGWQNPVNHNVRHHRLEIEAFPMDKWIEFKKMLFSEMQQSALHGMAVNAIKILEKIKELESFGKPEGM